MKPNILFHLILCIFLCSASFFALADSVAMHPAVGDTIHQVLAKPAANSTPINMWDFPNYHPLVVHFPIVLLLFAAFLQFLAHWRKELNTAVLILLFFGTVGAWLAASVFDAHPDSKMLSAEAKNIFHVHHQFSDYTTWLSTIALVLKIITLFIKKGKMAVELLVLLFLTGAAVTVSVAGHYGSYLVHIEGIGPKGNLLKK